MRLQWKDEGNGSFDVWDEASQLSAQVEKSGIDPEKPFDFFIDDVFAGRAATADEAMRKGQMDTLKMQKPAGFSGFLCV